MTPEQVRANISGSIEGQQYDAKQAAAAQNSANLGFGATTGGNGADDAEQVRLANQLLADNSDYRLGTSAGPPNSNLGYVNNDQGDLMNVFKGAQEYRQGFVNDLSGLLGSLTGQSTLNTNIPVTDLRPPVNANSNVADQFVNFDTLDQRIKDYENKFVSPY